MTIMTIKDIYRYSRIAKILLITIIIIPMKTHIRQQCLKMTVIDDKVVLKSFKCQFPSRN